MNEEQGVTQPIILNLGKKRRKRIRQLKKGRGKLWDEVMDVTDEIQASMGNEAQGKVIVPVVMVYRQKSKRRRRRRRRDRLLW